MLAASVPFLPAGGWRLGVVIVAGASDAADGLLARRLNASSTLGGILDAVADKLLTLMVLVVLYREGVLDWPLVLLLLARDIAVGLLALFAMLRRAGWAARRARSRPLGKVATLVIFATLVALLAWPRQAWWLIWPAGLFSLAAGLDYAIFYFRLPRQGARGD